MAVRLTVQQLSRLSQGNFLPRLFWLRDKSTFRGRRAERQAAVTVKLDFAGFKSSGNKRIVATNGCGGQQVAEHVARKLDGARIAPLRPRTTVPRVTAI